MTTSNIRGVICNKSTALAFDECAPCFGVREKEFKSELLKLNQDSTLLQTNEPIIDIGTSFAYVIPENHKVKLIRECGDGMCIVEAKTRHGWPESIGAMDDKSITRCYILRSCFKPTN